MNRAYLLNCTGCKFVRLGLFRIKRLIELDAPQIIYFYYAFGNKRLTLPIAFLAVRDLVNEF
jgi:hypothetical protein